MENDIDHKDVSDGRVNVFHINKRLKALASQSPSSSKRIEESSEGHVNQDAVSISSSKGKERIEKNRCEDDFQPEHNKDEENVALMCGICLSDGGGSLRGRIDSCDHYFCFVCIMEWSKVESRCPMCKRRFKSICRPPKEGIFLHERVVDVPIRDQVYHIFGNATVGPFDPYANVSCRECHGSQDENLLLLCDLCDAAAHSYCVGLGFTVPEGDWYCDDCSASKNEHFNSQLETNTSNQDSNILRSGEASCKQVSIFDIVCEDQVPGPSRSMQSQLESDTTVRNIANCEQSQSTTVMESQSVQSQTDISGRTLLRCRNLHKRIQAMRENWNSLRNGSLSFSSTIFDSESVIKHSRLTRSSSTRSAGESSSNNVERNWDSHVVNQKMKEVAKSIANSNAKAKSLHRSISKNPSSSGRPCDIDMSWKMMEAAKSIGDCCRGNNKSLYNSVNRIFSEVAKSKCALEKCEKREPEQRHKASQKSDCPSITQNTNSFHIDTSLRNHHQALSHAFCDGSGSMNSSSNDSNSRKPNLYFGRMKFDKSGSILDEEIERKRTKEPTRKADEAKSEIQSLVKLNLKLSTKDRKLEVDKFKRIARIATHTILAACGLEHTRCSVKHIQSISCTHLDQLSELHLCNLMPGVCRKCFYVFVKDVVNSIIDEKVCLQKS